MKRQLRYAQQLATEALFVGAIFIPWTNILTLALSNTNAPAYVITFLAGSTFHLLAEATGLNAYYLHHSAAQQADVERFMTEKKKPYKHRKPKCGICFLSP